MQLELRQEATPTGRPAGHNPAARVEAGLSLCTQGPSAWFPHVSHRAPQGLLPPSPSPVMTSSLTPHALSYLHHSAFDLPLGQRMSEPPRVGRAQLGGEERKGTAVEKGRKKRKHLCFVPDQCTWVALRQDGQWEARLGRQMRARWESPGLLSESPTPWAFVRTVTWTLPRAASPRSAWPLLWPAHPPLPPHTGGSLLQGWSASVISAPEPILPERPGQARAEVSQPVGWALPLVLGNRKQRQLSNEKLSNVPLDWYLCP